MKGSKPNFPELVNTISPLLVRSFSSRAALSHSLFNWFNSIVYLVES
jgi:hypothetical protein